MTLLNPYIHFSGNAREAMELYKSVFGGTLTLTTFKDAGMAQDPEDADKVMHSMLEADGGLVLMGSDTPKHMQLNPGATVTISLSGDDDALLTGYFEKLSAGGKVDQLLVAAPWGDKFGMFTDKFGVEWMVNVTAKKSAA